MIVDADHHRRAILPASLREARRDAERLPLGLDRATPLGATDPEQGYLPGLEPPPSLVSPVPWLTLYDLIGSGPVQTRGRGAPLAQRLFVEVLTAAHVGDRAPEWITAPPITLRDLFKWCWPRYSDVSKWNKQAREWGRWSGGYDRSKHLEPLRCSLLELDNMRIVYAGWERRRIRVDDLPTAATGLDEVVRFNVRQLPGCDRGPMFERAPARRWGVVSAPAWRTTIRLAYLWDEVKRRNQPRIPSRSWRRSSTHPCVVAARFRMSRSMRSCLFSRRSRRSSTSSSVLSPSLRCPASRSLWATQLRMDPSDGSYSRANSLGVRPDFTSSTICRGVLRWVGFMRSRHGRSLLSCSLYVSTKAGQLQSGSSGIVSTSRGIGRRGTSRPAEHGAVMRIRPLHRRFLRRGRRVTASGWAQPADQCRQSAR